MVDEQIVRRKVTNRRLLDVMRVLPRERFVPPNEREHAYDDAPVTIGEQQTLSQPYMAAVMTDALGLLGEERILEIGTGSGYQTALLASLAREVFTVEIVESLALGARARLEDLGFGNIRYRIGDGRAGWPEHAPYDGILVAAAPEVLPEPLPLQLGQSARLVIPIGARDHQELVVHERSARDGSELSRSKLGAVRFVPLV